MRIRDGKYNERICDRKNKHDSLLSKSITTTPIIIDKEARYCKTSAPGFVSIHLALGSNSDTNVT